MNKRLEELYLEISGHPSIKEFDSFTMTDEEKKEYRRKQDSILLNDEPGSRMFTYCDNYKSIDWLNEHYFDYRGLIGKGLALEAPKGMYE